MTKTRSLLTFMLLLFLIGAVFAYWSEKIEVYVIGKDGRALKNADVSVIYQGMQCGSHEQIDKQTNDQGFVNFEFINTVDDTFNPKCIERTYTILASYMGKSNQTGGALSNVDKRYFITLPLLEYILIVVDGSNRTLSNVTVTTGGAVFTTDAAGETRFSLPMNEPSEVRVSYGTVIRALSITPSTTANSSTTKLPIYDLKINLFDENGQRINGTIQTGSRQEVATVFSPAVFLKFSQETARFLITSGRTQKLIDVTITSDSIDIYFDFSPPPIRDVKAEAGSGKNVVVTAAVSDDGTYASGMSGNPTLSYSLGDLGYLDLKMYPTSSRTFEGTIPAKGADVTYRITVSDKQGNTNSYEGKYSFGGILPVGNGDEEEKPAAGISPVQFAGILIFIVVVIFVYQKIKEQFG